MIGPLATGALAAAYGWHAGFALAAALMLMALGVYLSGRRHLTDSRPAKSASEKLPLLRLDERRRAAALVCAILLVVPAFIPFNMIGGIGMIWIDQYVDLRTPLGSVPVGWFNSVDSFVSILTAPVLIALWTWQARSRREPAAITKIAIGSALIGLSSLVLALGSYLSPAPGSVSVAWAILGYGLMGVAFMWYWPVLLALISGNAPGKVNSTMMGLTFVAIFIASVTAGWVGSFYDQMSPAAFWTLNAAIALAGGIIALLCGPALQRALAFPEMAATSKHEG